MSDPQTPIQRLFGFFCPLKVTYISQGLGLDYFGFLLFSPTQTTKQSEDVGWETAATDSTIQMSGLTFTLNRPCLEFSVVSQKVGSI